MLFLIRILESLSKQVFIIQVVAQCDAPSISRNLVGCIEVGLRQPIVSIRPNGAFQEAKGR